MMMMMMIRLGRLVEDVLQKMHASLVHPRHRILPSHTRDLQNGGIESVNEMRTPHTTRTQATCSLRRRSVQVQYTVEAMGADLM